MAIENEDTITAAAETLATELIDLAERMRAFKTRYDWYTWTQNAQQPIATIDAGVQNLDAVQTDVLTTRRDPLYNLASAPKPIEE